MDNEPIRYSRTTESETKRLIEEQDREQQDEEKLRNISEKKRIENDQENKYRELLEEGNRLRALV